MVCPMPFLSSMSATRRAPCRNRKKLAIPVIGVVDTNNSTDGVNYVIPGNDDSSGAIRLYARGVADAILEGRNQIIREIVSDEFVELEEGGEESAPAQQ